MAVLSLRRTSPSHRFNICEDAIEQSLRLLLTTPEDELAWLRAEARKGIESQDASRYQTFDKEQLKAEAKRRFGASW